jgi:curved DNA-binding protein CbpA
MSTLYETLGVARDADVAAIRKAYRSKAKKAHPDTGGSVEKFAELTLAHDCLTDAERRKRYDETGEVLDNNPDTTEAKAMNLAFGALSHVVWTIIQTGGRFYDYDVIDDAVKKLKIDQGSIETKIHMAKRSATELKSLSDKFRAKKGKANRFGPMIASQAAEAERAVAAAEADMEIVKAAIEIVQDHQFGGGPGRTTNKPETLEDYMKIWR